MVSKEELKEYDFKIIEDYYDYIEESLINGQMQQSRKLIKKLSKDQKKDAFKYFWDLNEEQERKRYRELMIAILDAI